MISSALITMLITQARDAFYVHFASADEQLLQENIRGVEAKDWRLSKSIISSGWKIERTCLPCGPSPYKAINVERCDLGSLQVWNPGYNATQITFTNCSVLAET